MIMVTTDGSDECGRLDQSCGINAPNLASLMLNHFNTQEAMSMDQGTFQNTHLVVLFPSNHHYYYSHHLSSL